MYLEDILYDYAMSFVGQPYLWGGDDPVHGFDCSGLCLELLQSVGVFPRGKDTTASGLAIHFESYKTTHPHFGSLAFFGKAVGGITHVGFCLNEYVMLEAGGGGSKTVSKEDAAKQNAYVRVRPIDWRGDLVGFRHPPYPFLEE